jgi:hypothetical protein
MMAKTAAERQRDYRANRPFASENGEHRLDLWVTTSTNASLKRLAKHNGITQRAMLEQLIQVADKRVQAKLSDDELDVYLLPGN